MLRLDLDLPADQDAPGRARVAVDELGEQLDPALFQDLRLIVSELVTNAVIHGPAGRVSLQLEIDPPATIRGEVTDDGHGTPAIRARDETKPGGMGLRILDSLAVEWGVHEGSTHVWFELRS